MFAYLPTLTNSPHWHWQPRDVEEVNEPRMRSQTNCLCHIPPPAAVSSQSPVTRSRLRLPASSSLGASAFSQKHRQSLFCLLQFPWRLRQCRTARGGLVARRLRSVKLLCGGGRGGDVCVCVCVCVRERERETDRQTDRNRQTEAAVHRC